MILWTFQITIISVVLILLVHHLIVFFKNTLTVPKVKDLVNAPMMKYEDMYHIIHQEKSRPKIRLDEILPTSVATGSVATGSMGSGSVATGSVATGSVWSGSVGSGGMGSGGMDTTKFDSNGNYEMVENHQRKDAKIEMKNELKNFLKKQLSQGTDITSLESKSYASF
jgi:hypothetical protein